jgi:hypothetical protein
MYGKISAERSSALVGMQPQFEQMPPRKVALDDRGLEEPSWRCTDRVT